MIFALQENVPDLKERIYNATCSALKTLSSRGVDNSTSGEACTEMIIVREFSDSDVHVLEFVLLNGTHGEFYLSSDYILFQHQNVFFCFPHFPVSLRGRKLVRLDSYRRAVLAEFSLTITGPRELIINFFFSHKERGDS